MTNRRLFAELSPARAATALACWGFFVVCLFGAVLDERMLPLYYSLEPISLPLVADTLFGGGAIGFHAHVSSFFFTDYLPYFALHALFDGDFRLALPALVFFFGVVGAVGWTLFMQLHTSRKFAVVCVTPLVFGLLFFNLAFVDLPLLRPDDGENHDLGAWQFYLWENAFYLIKPGHRAGTFAAFPFCLWLLARFLYGGGGARAAALAVVVVAVTASDPIMLAWFFIPAGAFVLWRAGGKLRDIRREFYLLTAACIAGFLLREVINNYFFAGVSRNLSGFIVPETHDERNYIFLFYLPLWAKHDPAGFAYWLASFALLFYAALSAAFGAQTRAAARLLLLAAVSSFLATYLSGHPAPRYMLPFWFGPALFSPLLLVALAGKWLPAPPRLARRAAVVAALFAFAAAAAHAAIRPASPVVGYDLPERQCLDDYAQQYNLQKGLGGGMAKPIRAFVQSSMRPYTTGSRAPKIEDVDNWHLAEGDNFNFIIIDTFEPLKIKWDGDAFVGAPPIAKLQCGKYALHVYPSFTFLDLLWKRKSAISVASGASERVVPPAPASVAPQGLAKRTPLMRAIRQHESRLSPAAVSLFARAGDDVNAQDILGRTPLHNAARRAPADVVAALVAAGAQVDAADKLGITPLHRAAGKVNKAAAVAALLAGGANPNSANLLGETPLHAAAKYANCGILKALIAAGGNPAAPDLRGNTPQSNLRASYQNQPWFLPYAVRCLG